MVEHSKNKIKLQLAASEILPEDSCYDDGPEEIAGRIDEAENKNKNRLLVHSAQMNNTVKQDNVGCSSTNGQN